MPLSKGRGGCCWSQSQLSLGEGRVHPEEVAAHCSPSLMAAAHQEQFGIQYLAQGHFDTQLSSARGEPGSEPATFQSPVDLLYPLSYSHPHSVNIDIFNC